MDILVLVSLAIFYVLFAGRTFMLYLKGVRVFAPGGGQRVKILEILMLPALIAWSVVLVLTALGVELPLLFSGRFHMRNWPTLIGILLCYGGLVIFFSALMSFGNAWRIGIDEKNPHSLVTTGIFGMSRNPVFLFVDMYFLGIALIYPSIFFVLSFIAAAVCIHVQIRREESFLLSAFGEEYERYTDKVRRYF